MKFFLVGIAALSSLAWPAPSFSAVSSTRQAEELRSELDDLRKIMGDIQKKMEETEKRIAALEAQEGKTAASTAAPAETKKKWTDLFQQGPGKGIVYGAKGSLFNPDISFIADTNYSFRQGPNLHFGDFEKNRLEVREVEMDAAAYLYPGVRGWTTFSWAPEEGNVDLEEAYVTFETLPFKSSLTFGRRLIDYGLVNPIHQHFRPYVDEPLIFSQLFGEAYIDDGFLYSILLPTPDKLTAKLSVGIYDGKQELVDLQENPQGLEFKGHVLELGGVANYSISDSMDISSGYNVLLDKFSGRDLAIHEANVVLRYYFPGSDQKILWQNEVYVPQRPEGTEPVGFFSLARYTLNKYWDVGLRGDWTELLENDHKDAFGITPYLTWNITEATFARLQYRYIDEDGRKPENQFFLQFIFGFGPHSHRVEY